MISLSEELKNIFCESFTEKEMYSDEYIISSKIDNGFEISIGSMYTAPQINFKILKQLSDLFGTIKIDVDDYSNSGCETCDYGSNYGHSIQILEPTKNISQMQGLLDKNLLEK